MKVILQRSLASSVSVDHHIVGAIEHGLVIFVGFTEGDTMKEIDQMVDKLIHLRIFDDEFGVMNHSLQDVGGSILSISQFTLYADTKKGRRPSYACALKASDAVTLYDYFNKALKEQHIPVETGVFGANMSVSITNDGPVTIIMESREAYAEK